MARLSRPSRRDVLKSAVVGFAALSIDAALAACGQKPLTTAVPTTAAAASAVPTDTPTETVTPAATAVPTDTPTAPPTEAATPAASPTPGIPDLVVVRKGEPEALVRRAVEALGGMARFVPSGASVIVKPNICVAYRTYEYAATTNPWVVGALVKMALEAGAREVKVLDYPYGGDAAQAYATSGIGAQVKAAGGQMVVMSSRRYVSTAIPSGKWLKRTEVYEDVLKADVIINVPIAKVHSAARMTAGMKNLMGVVRDRSEMHGRLDQAIADLATLVRPKLTVVDAIRVLKANGPGGGRLGDVKKLDTIVASADIVAADVYTTSFLGLRPRDVDYLAMGAALGIGRTDLSKLRVLELTA